MLFFSNFMVLEYKVVEQGDDIDIIFLDPELVSDGNSYAVTFTYVNGDRNNTGSYRHDGAVYTYKDMKGVVRGSKEVSIVKVAGVLQRQGTTTVELLKKYLDGQNVKTQAA